MAPPSGQGGAGTRDADKTVGQRWAAGLLWTPHRSSLTTAGEVTQTKLNHNVRMFLISTRSLQHGIVLAGADFGIAGDHLTPVFERLS
jgi:hypothetical protein